MHPLMEKVGIEIGHFWKKSKFVANIAEQGCIAKERKAFWHMTENEISNIVIGCAIEVHKQLGPGLLESAYQKCLYYEIQKKGLRVTQEQAMPIVYKEVKLDHGYRMDLVVEDKVVIEIKTVDALADVHKAQVLTYLKLGNYQLGLLINFQVALLKTGIKRIVNNLI